MSEKEKFDYENFKKKAQERKASRNSNLSNLRVDNRDMLSTKAMVAMLGYIMSSKNKSGGNTDESSLGDILKRAGIDEKSELYSSTVGIMKEIEKQREVGKELDLKILQTDPVKEAIKKFDPANFENNMNELKEAIQNQGKELNVEHILGAAKRSDTNTAKDVSKNAMRLKQQ